MRIFGFDIGAVEALIMTNVIVFFVSIGDMLPLEYLVLNSVTVFEYPWALITSMFLHGGFNHLLFNMIALFFFGMYLFRLTGEKDFLRIYTTNPRKDI